jgi:hypothetical protein
MLKLLRWFFGGGWAIASIGFIGDSIVVGGLLLLIGGLLLLPPTFGLIARATGSHLSKPIKYIAVILPLLAAAFIIIPKQEAKAAAEKAAAAASAAEKKKQEQLAYARLTPAAKDSIKKAAAREEKAVKAQAARAAEYASKKERREKVEAQFSAYDGSHPAVERAIKTRMNDPDSYEHVTTRFKDEGTYILVYTQFRGKNAFNAKVMSVATAKVDFSGNVVDLQM